MGGIIAFYCQAFFAWRLRVLTGNNWIAGIVFFFGFCVMSTALLERGFAGTDVLV